MKVLTSGYWAKIIHDMRFRLAHALLKSEVAATHPDFGIESVPGVEVVSMVVWSEGKSPCREHCWHTAHAPASHRTASWAGKHSDFVCCHCTHGMCRTATDLPASLRPPVPKTHLKVKHGQQLGNTRG